MKKLLSFLLAVTMLMACLPVLSETGDSSQLPNWGSESALENLLSSGNMVTTILTTPFYEGVTDEDSAGEALETVLEQLGADESTQLMMDSVYTTEDLTYYTFRQMVGDVIVEGASVKLIADPNGTAVCVVSSLLSGLDGAALEAVDLTEEEAESIVAERIQEQPSEVKKGMSHQAVIPFGDESRLVWVVYTDNYFTDVDVGYLAHYVSGSGEYLGATLIATPYSTDVETNSIAELVFMGMESDVWSGEVTLFDGTKRYLAVPVMKDEEGNTYLGDLQRRIICVDYSAWENQEEIEMRTMQDGRFDDGELLIYESIIRAWDFYNEIGWPGGDGKGTPIMLKMDMVDENGVPIHNAYYSNMYAGFQTFAFNRDDRDGETMDVIGHEFTHCVTTTISVDAPYKNDCGAINEALSDIMGNLMEEMLGASDDPDWLIGEAAKNPAWILRCMSNPHLYCQPEHVWDVYYTPAVEVGNDFNDMGGVHTNSSLLNLIAWRLHEAGMAPEDEFDYMMSVILAMTGTITYPDLAVLLPWCLEKAGLDEYMETLRKAIDETGIAEIIPKTIPQGYIMVTASIPGEPPIVGGDLRLVVENEAGGYVTECWPDCRLHSFVLPLPAGTYAFRLIEVESERIWNLTDDGWIEITDLSADEQPAVTCYPFEEGYFYSLPLDGLTENTAADAA